MYIALNCASHVVIMFAWILYPLKMASIISLQRETIIALYITMTCLYVWIDWQQRMMREAHIDAHALCSVHDSDDSIVGCDLDRRDTLAHDLATYTSNVHSDASPCDDDDDDDAGTAYMVQCDHVPVSLDVRCGQDEKAMRFLHDDDDDDEDCRDASFLHNHQHVSTQPCATGAMYDDGLFDEDEDNHCYVCHKMIVRCCSAAADNNESCLRDESTRHRAIIAWSEGEDGIVQYHAMVRICDDSLCLMRFRMEQQQIHQTIITTIPP